MIEVKIAMTDEQAQKAYDLLNAIRTTFALPENSTEGDKQLISSIDELLTEIDAEHIIKHIPVMQADSAAELFQRYKEMREAAESIDQVRAERDEYLKTSATMLNQEKMFIGHLIAIQELILSEKERRFREDQLTVMAVESREYNQLIARWQAYNEVEVAAKAYLTADWNEVKADMVKLHSSIHSDTFKFEEVKDETSEN